MVTPLTRLLALEAAAVALLVLTLATWFAGSLRGIRPGVAGACLAATLVARAWVGGAGDGAAVVADARPESLVCLAAAVVYRLPALLHPWGWVNRDGAYGAFVTLHLLQGDRPAPVFTEGANYQGTLKSHLAALLALLTGARDLSFLMTAASLVLYLIFTASAMALARRVGGRPAALATGLYLALGPRFLTVFSLNCVGQYVDVLALGGVALALLARLLDEDRRGIEPAGPISCWVSCWVRPSGNNPSPFPTPRWSRSCWPCGPGPGAIRGRCSLPRARCWARCPCCSGMSSTAGRPATSSAASR